MTPTTGRTRAGALVIATGLMLAACTTHTEPMGLPGSQPAGSHREGPDSTTAGPTEPTSAPSTNQAAGGPAASTYRRIAVVGCSQTRDAVHGFNAVADAPIFGSDQDQEYLSAGTIDRWAANSGHWRRFATLHGGDADIDAVWIMVCWHVRNTEPSTSVETVERIIDRAQEVIGHTVPVFVSGLNDWDPRSICPKADWVASWTLADQVVAAGLAERGPELGPITETQTTDGCHGTAEGNAVMGTQVASFFLGT
ncbi:MAG: hypothetical protein ACFCVC_03115 [Acidimicrobiia bacterium]